MTESDQDDVNRRANEKAKKRKQARDKMLATKTIEKGLVIVHTGKGKGKSTAAFGLAARAIGNGMKVGIVQYVKGKWDTGERVVMEKFPDQVTIAPWAKASPGKPRTGRAMSPLPGPRGKLRRR